MEDSAPVEQTTRHKRPPKAASAQTQRRSVLITGASNGIGRALSLALAARGYRVIAGVRREIDAVALRESATEPLNTVLLDVTDSESIRSARSSIETLLAGDTLDALINNAGIAVGGPLECTPLSAVRHQFEVNVFGQLAVFQEFAPLLRAARGRIVNIGSMTGFFSTAFQGPYCASKHALEAFTDSMRRELEPFGMHVLLIQPGSIESRLIDKANEHSRARLRTLTDDQRALYGEAAERSLYAAAMAAEHAARTDGIIRAVTHALESKRPRPRYLVGVDAHIGKLLARALPDGALDWLFKKLDQALQKKLKAEAATRTSVPSTS